MDTAPSGPPGPTAAAAAGERVELFHLLHDPSERHDQAGARPEVVKTLRARLDVENARR